MHNKLIHRNLGGGISEGIDSQAITLLRFPLAVMVVFLHINPFIDGWSISAMQSANIGANIAGTIMLAISHILTHIAVPTFFLISGYLFFQKLQTWNKEVWLRKMKSRMHTTVIPYFIWVSFYIFIALDRKILGVLIKGKPISGITDWINSQGGFLKLYWCSSHWNDSFVDIWGHSAMSTGPCKIPLWFLRDMIVLIAITPILYYLFRCTKTGGLSKKSILSFIILAFLYITQTATGIPGVSFSTIFYFGLGAFISLNGKTITEVFYKYRLSLLLWALTMFIVLIPMDGPRTPLGNILYPLYIFPGVLTAYNLAAASIIKNNSIKPLAKYSSATFFIYVFHPFIFGFVKPGISKINKMIFNASSCTSLDFVNSHPITTLFFYFLTVLTTVTICIITYNLMSRFTPRLKTLTCGR